MSDLSQFPIASRWPAEQPDRLQLYSVPTPNGVKVSIMLEETGLPYEPHFIPLGEGGTQTAEFRSLNPRQIPRSSIRRAGGAPMDFRIGAILITSPGRPHALPRARRHRDPSDVQMGGLGPFRSGRFFPTFAPRVSGPAPARTLLR